MSRGWSAIARWASVGVTSSTSLSDARQIRVVNMVALIVATICTVSIPFDISTAPGWTVVEDVVLAPAFLTVLLLNHKRRAGAARRALLVLCFLTVIGNALLLGRASGQHLLLLPMAVLPFVIFGSHELRAMLGYSLFAALSMLIVQVWGFDLVAAHVTLPKVGAYYEVYSTAVTLVVLVFSVRNFAGAHALTERALVAREERYRLITDLARDAIITVDGNDHIEFASPACAALCGQPAETLLGRHIDLLLPGGLVLPRAEAGVRDALHVDGRRVPVEISVGASQLAPGLRTVIIRDITERVRAQRQIDAARASANHSAKLAALGELASGVAHEINNPLTALGLAADHLRRNVDAGKVVPEDVRYTAQRIRRITGRIEKIVSALRFFARDGSRDRMQRTSVRQLFDDTLELCKERFREHAVELQVDAGPEALDIECRGVEVSQVLLNLLSNAHDAVAGQPSAWVRLEASAVDDQVLFAVTDSNSGIAAAIRDRVFEPFFTTKGVGKGTGLGLSVSHGIVLAHRGRIELDAAAAHTRFVVWLPRTQPEP